MEQKKQNPKKLYLLGIVLVAQCGWETPSLQVYACMAYNLLKRQCLLRLDKNNCLVPVPYGPESQVGSRSGKYYIFNKKFLVTQ